MNATEMAALRDRQARHDDAQVRRCWCCGAWAWAKTDCRDCTAPADRTDLLKETS